MLQWETTILRSLAFDWTFRYNFAQKRTIYINGWYIQPYTCTWGRWNSKKKCGKRLSFCVEERCRHICLVNIQVSYGSSIIGTHLWIWGKKHTSSGCQDLLNCGGHGWYGFNHGFSARQRWGFRSQNQNGCIRLHSSNWWFFFWRVLKLGCWYWKMIPVLFNHRFSRLVHRWETTKGRHCSWKWAKGANFHAWYSRWISYPLPPKKKTCEHKKNVKSPSLCTIFNIHSQAVWGLVCIKNHSRGSIKWSWRFHLKTEGFKTTLLKQQCHLTTFVLDSQTLVTSIGQVCIVFMYLVSWFFPSQVHPCLSARSLGHPKAWSTFQ